MDDEDNDYFSIIYEQTRRDQHRETSRIINHLQRGGQFDLLCEYGEPLRIVLPDGTQYGYDAVHKLLRDRGYGYSTAMSHLLQNGPRRTGTRTGRVPAVEQGEWPTFAEFVKKYGGTPKSPKTKRRNAEFAEWFDRRYGRTPRPHNFADRALWARFEEDRQSKTDRQEKTVSMTKQQLLDMQAAAARQLAETEAELKKYEAFPTEAEVLEQGDVIRFAVLRDTNQPVPANIVITYDAGYDPVTGEAYKEAQLQRAAVGDDGHPLPPGAYVAQMGSRRVKKSYDYVGLYVKETGLWYVTSTKGRQSYTYDDLLKFMVDGGVTTLLILGQVAEFSATTEPAATDHVAAATQAVNEARQHVAKATQAMEVEDKVVAGPDNPAPRKNA